MRPAFRFPCYTKLNIVLGELDACAECQEIAVRDFVEKCKDAADPAAVIQERSRHYGIKVDVVDLARFARRNTELQLVSVSQAFEGFLDDFIAEHPRLGFRPERKKGVLLLDAVVDKVAPLRDAKALRASVEYQVYNYYRGLRNEVAHVVDRDTEKLTATLTNLKKDCTASPEYARLDAPHSFQELTFDDFVLFTRTAKRLASLLCDAGALNDDEVLDWASTHLPTKGTPERKANALRARLRIAFNLAKDRSDAMIERILPLAGQ
ncbi:MAG TPA: hypothetical protein VFQ91_27540 [Bryobacteraceae bacterium]|nr:hypothetical protein [Bryobacteraceae bacterium]